MASKIDTITKRRNLIPRRDPYFERMFPGRSLGYRKSRVKGGTWIARIKVDGDGYRYRSIGADDTIDYEKAIKEASAWFELVGQLDKGADFRYTVKQCVEDYISHLKIENSASSATRTNQSLKKHLIPALGSIELSRLTTARLKRWRDGLVKESEDPEVVRKSKDTANRVLSMAKAAFNLAFRSGSAGSDTAWRRVPAFKDVGENRKLFLTTAQVESLINNSEGQFKNLLIAARLTGARYGELANARVRDLDPFNGTLHLEGKTGARYCYLSDDTLEFFKKLIRERLPNAFLLVKDDGEPWGKSHQHRPMKSAVRQSKLPPDTVFYSIRHYHISKALLAGIPAQVVAENCGTSIRMLEKHYAKFMGTDRRRMMNEVAL